MGTLLRDLRYALRSFGRNIGFTASAVLTLALGIGATTVVFSIVDHVVLRPLDFAHPDRLVVGRLTIREVSNAYPTLPVNAMHFGEWRRHCTLCDGVAALRSGAVTLTGAGDPERLNSIRVSASLFPVLGARPVLGRLFSTEDDQPGHDRVAVLSDAFWQRRFGADPAVLGRTITLDDAPYVVIGVMPSSFRLPKGHELGDPISFPSEPQLFVPLALTPRELNTPGEFDYAVIARLKAGVTLTQVRNQLDALEAGILARMSDKLTIHAVLKPLKEQVVGASGRALIFLLVAVGAVLLLVCINIAMLLLARNSDRLRESAIRVALGARRARLVRQALTESLVLALAGGLLGVILSYWGLAALLALAPADLPRLNEVQLDGRVLLVSFVVSTIAGLTFGILPALRFGDADPGELLKTGGRTSTQGRRGLQSRSVLIASQVALSTVLLVATGLLITSFVRVLGVDKGFDTERVLALDILLPYAGYDSLSQRMQFYERALDRLRSMPGVTSAAVTNALPLEGESQINTLSMEHDPRPPVERPLVNIRYVSPGYFGTMGTPIRRGRALSESDRGSDVAVLSERAARSLWPHEDAIGKRVAAGDSASPAEVVGVVADVPATSLEEKGSLTVYYPYWQSFPFWPGASWSGSMLVRTTVDPASVATVARARLRQVDPAVLITKIRTMAQVVSVTVAQRRFQLILLTLFAVTALVTASIGIYGTTTYSVLRRANEIGIRMVLGAHASDIHWLVMREGLTPVAAGLGAGIVLSLMLGRAFTSLLFEVRPSDPFTLVGVAVLLALVAAVACYLPGRRATAADPIASLRLE